ncbi:MAG: MarR family transcriptional regulator [Clostridia bacterium]
MDYHKMKEHMTNDEVMQKRLAHAKKAKHILPHIKFLHDRMEKLGNKLLREKDLTLPQAHVLGYLRSKQDLQAPFKDVEKTMNVAQSTAAGIIARLEKKSFIETFYDPNDKRVKIVHLSENGLNAMKEIRVSFDQVENQLLQNLSNEEKETFFELILKINQPTNK